jgi:hypothetical protein
MPDLVAEQIVRIRWEACASTLPIGVNVPRFDIVHVLAQSLNDSIFRMIK